METQAIMKARIRRMDHYAGPQERKSASSLYGSKEMAEDAGVEKSQEKKLKNRRRILGGTPKLPARPPPPPRARRLPLNIQAAFPQMACAQWAAEGPGAWGGHDRGRRSAKMDHAIPLMEYGL
jgi:hypothetical protein